MVTASQWQVDHNVSIEKSAEEAYNKDICRGGISHVYITSHMISFEHSCGISVQVWGSLSKFCNLYLESLTHAQNSIELLLYYRNRSW